MTWTADLPEEIKIERRAYHKNYNREYYRNNQNLRNNGKMCRLRKKYIVPDEHIAIFGNSLANIYKLQELLEVIPKSLFEKYMDIFESGKLVIEKK